MPLIRADTSPPRQRRRTYPGQAPPNTVSRRTVVAILAGNSRRYLPAIPRRIRSTCTSLWCSVGQARFFLEKQKGNPGAASVPLGPSGHPKLSDGRVAAGGGARLAAVDANSATVAVSSPALSAPVRRAAGPARRQTSEIQVVLKRCTRTKGYYIPCMSWAPPGLSQLTWEIERSEARRKSREHLTRVCEIDVSLQRPNF